MPIGIEVKKKKVEVGRISFPEGSFRGAVKLEDSRGKTFLFRLRDRKKVQEPKVPEPFKQKHSTLAAEEKQGGI